MSREPEAEPSVSRAQEVKERHEAQLLRMPNVLGVGVGLRKRAGAMSREVAIVVLVSRKLPQTQLAPEEILPKEIDGVPVDVQEVGEVQAQGGRSGFLGDP
jgi:hypothetical protein